ncbi:RNA polymerase sigma factor [Pedobacter frigoris]|uniref:Sigma-70 family RNA polymerase sigma factor n=1 Tax=Pedobacter frigoris TaxID=2571272 RepID=A0A4U1CHE5_9SPHI|nr:sigma-70 family RNA polymerase sigma factor [Pedobacter frigoris]TKC06205.1 sigma-70 family RNA polymerase sigma factor [Pedobacter frigoris]
MLDCKKLSDAQLVDLLKESNYKAYDEIYNRYHYLMITHAYKKLKDEDLAQDVIQEVFANLWVKRESDLTAVNLVGYLYTCTRNKILDIFGHQKIESKYISSFSDFTLNNGVENTDHLVREKEFKAYIEKEIQALPKKMRQIFEMSRKEHYSHKEIAEILNTSEYNVSKQITNALKILRARLGIYLFIVLILNYLSSK